MNKKVEFALIIGLLSIVVALILAMLFALKSPDGQCVLNPIGFGLTKMETQNPQTTFSCSCDLYGENGGHAVLELSPDGEHVLEVDDPIFANPPDLGLNLTFDD